MPLDVLKTQRLLGASVNAVLDDPQNPETHLRNLEVYATETANDKELCFVPVIPCDLSSKHLHKIVSIWPAPTMIAVGKVVPRLFPLSNQDNISYVIRRLKEIKEIFPKSKIHLFGLGGFATATIFFHIINSTDSSSWIHDARFRRIRLLGGGFVRPDRPKSRAALLEQPTCVCPACKEHGPDVLDIVGSRGFQLRALHNAWVLNKEMEILNQNISSGNYLDFVIKRVGKSNWHKKLLKCMLQLYA